MSRSSFKLPRLVEWLVVAAIAGVLLCCLVPAVREASGPLGDRLARQPPNEANRFHSVEGYSIVVPSDWETKLLDDMLLISPKWRGRARGRDKAHIEIAHHGRKKPPDIEGMRKTTFLGRDAYEGMKVVRRSTFDDDAWSAYTLYFQHGDEWLSLGYGIAEERTTLPDSIRNYLNTFRWDEAKTGPGSEPALPSAR